MPPTRDLPLSHHPVGLSVLDLVPIASGSNAREAIANTIALAQQAEALGYRRYWIAEHHLNPGVAGTTPSLIIGLVAEATETIRVGSGAVQLGHQTPLSVVEQFGILDALHPGRVDLGLGRSGRARRRPSAAEGDARPSEDPGRTPRPKEARRTPRGLLIPAPFSLAALMRSPRFALHRKLLQQPGAETPDYAEQIADIVALIDGTYCSDGVEAHVIPGERAAVDIWILGSSGGPSAQVAGERGLPFAANYHVSPASVLEAVEGYRAAFRPSPRLDRPYVLVSADAVVGGDDEHARELAAGYGAWVYSIRSGAGAIPFPTPAEASRHQWTDDARALVKDRIDTQFVGSAATVADQLDVLVADTGADELLITTITHDHGDRATSYRLLAEEWARRA
jgi:alkanesulfonate monooxygenase SsuD/methylene tetrahydromethanopterin reductase-like flavin-dependent oxidoreductase (luciferase family)